MTVQHIFSRSLFFACKFQYIIVSLRYNKKLINSFIHSFIHSFNKLSQQWKSQISITQF